MAKQEPLIIPPPEVTPEAIIKAARDILSDRRRWARYVFLARRTDGKETSALDPKATAWSIVGALRKAARDLGIVEGLVDRVEDAGWPLPLWEAYDRAEAAILTAPSRFHRHNLVSLNRDSFLMHEEVVQLFDRALNEPKSKRRKKPKAA